MDPSSLYSAIKNARRKRWWWGHKKLYEPMAPVTRDELDGLEAAGGYSFPVDVRNALLALGGCSIDDLYLHPAKHIRAFDDQSDAVSGKVAYASDIFGNLFAFDPRSSNPCEVLYFSHDPPGYALAAPSFQAYLEAFVASGFDTVSITAELDLTEC